MTAINRPSLNVGDDMAVVLSKAYLGYDDNAVSRESTSHGEKCQVDVNFNVVDGARQKHSNVTV